MCSIFIPAAKSIERYRGIEKDSGVGFFHEVGFLTIGRQIQNASEKGLIRPFYYGLFR